MPDGPVVLRIAKSLLVAQAGVFSLLVAYNNIVDYGSNYQFVQHVLSMDTTFDGNRLMGRALTAEWMHHAAYALIIAAEAVTGLLCVSGAVLLYRARRTAEAFESKKILATLGLVLGITLWFTGFMTVGAEWFLMWQSEQWNGQQAAFRFIVLLFATLLFLHQTETVRSSADTDGGR